MASLPSFVATRDFAVIRFISDGQRMIDRPDGSLVGILNKDHSFLVRSKQVMTRLHWFIAPGSVLVVNLCLVIGLVSTKHS